MKLWPLTKKPLPKLVYIAALGLAVALVPLWVVLALALLAGGLAFLAVRALK